MDEGRVNRTEERKTKELRDGRRKRKKKKTDTQTDR